MGYLAAGLLLGPGGVGLVSPDAVGALAELGVALLLFSIGLELSLARLRRLGAAVLGTGILQIVLTIPALAAAGRLLGLPWPVALAAGIVLCPSSTAAVLRLLSERTELDSQHGRLATGVLLAQDAAVVPLALLLGVVAAGGAGTIGAGGPGAVLRSLGALAGGLAALLLVLLVARRLLPLLVRVAAARDRELSILVAVVVVLAAAWGAHAAGLSPALGAFAAGILVAESPFAVQVRADVGPLRVLFVTLFFASVGMVARPSWFAARAGVLALVVPGLLLAKAAMVLLACRLWRVPWRHGLAAGLAVAQAGEFGFVLAGRAGDLALLPAPVLQTVLPATFATLALSPWLVRLAAALARGPAPGAGARAATAEPATTAERADHVVVVGYGPAGREVALACRARGVAVVVIELSPATADAARRDGHVVVSGDGAGAEVLEHAHLRTAAALCVTVPDHAAAAAVVTRSRALAPPVPVVCRARHHRFLAELRAAGATDLYDEEGRTGRGLAELVLGRIATS